jgi:NAD(P)-dependent dehydrogenase (short-subunit alcohol dehydrogenase family)
MQYGQDLTDRGEMLQGFDGQVGIVTGAASGLGRRSAILLARQGARLVLFDRDAAGLAATAADSPGAVRVTGDVTHAADISAAVAAAAELGPIRLLATAAGILGPTKPLTDIDEADWDRLFDINVKGTWLVLRAALPHMRAAGGGAVVCFSSAAGLTGSETMPAYSASKGAVVMLTRSAARSEAQYGIRVNCVCPGSIDTPMLEATFAAAEGAEARAQRETAFRARHPLGRFGEADEVAAAVVFLLSSAASFITGAALPVDGGRLA